jgi:hypothetical protein
MLAALWGWNRPGDLPSPDCMVDHGVVDDWLRCELGDCEMPHPRSKDGAD